jgi:HEAT repeat protein
MASPAFERFQYSFFEDKDSARDALDVAALQALEGEERARAEEMLLQYLPDMRAVIGLGELHSKRAEGAITEMLESEKASEFKYSISTRAKALWQIRPDPRWRDIVVEVLSESSREIERMHAAEALKAFHDQAAVSALLKALDDPAGLVRHHAARSLLAIHGLPDFSVSWDRQHMVYQVMSKDLETQEAAKKGILDTIAGR